MRLGVYPCKTLENTLIRKAYGQEILFERHRHRYEFNNSFMDIPYFTGFDCIRFFTGYEIGGVN